MPWAHGWLRCPPKEEAWKEKRRRARRHGGAGVRGLLGGDAIGALAVAAFEGLVRPGPPLLVRGPFATLITLRLRSGPQAHHAPVWLLAGDVDRRESKAPAGVPGHPPVAYALLDCGDDLGRH